jgi:hypothetical protein
MYFPASRSILPNSLTLQWPNPPSSFYLIAPQTWFLLLLLTTSVTTTPVYPLPLTSASCPPRLHRTLCNHHLSTSTPGSSQRARPANRHDKRCQMPYSARSTRSNSTFPGQTYPPPSLPTAKPSSCSTASLPAVRGNQGMRQRSSAS